MSYRLYSWHITSLYPIFLLSAHFFKMWNHKKNKTYAPYRTVPYKVISKHCLLRPPTAAGQITSDVSPWPSWSLRPKILHQVLGLGIAIQILDLGLECLVWLVFDTSCKWQKFPCCTGVMVSSSSGNMYRHMVMALFTYHLSNVSNLHLILGNLLLVSLMWVRGLGHLALIP